MKLDEHALRAAIMVLECSDPSVETSYDIAPLVISAYFNALPVDYSGYADDNPPERIELPGVVVDGPRGPEFIAQPNYAALGIDDPEGRN